MLACSLQCWLGASFQLAGLQLVYSRLLKAFMIAPSHPHFLAIHVSSITHSVRDLLQVHELTGIPAVFDFHHHGFCTGGWSEEQAFRAAIATWPQVCGLCVVSVCVWEGALTSAPALAGVRSRLYGVPSQTWPQVHVGASSLQAAALSLVLLLAAARAQLFTRTQGTINTQHTMPGCAPDGALV